MPIKGLVSRSGGYDVSVGRVTNPGRAMADGSIAIRTTSGNARLCLHFTPKDAARIAAGLAAAVLEATNLP